jgi:hypothetical protein
MMELRCFSELRAHRSAVPHRTVRLQAFQHAGLIWRTRKEGGRPKAGGSESARQRHFGSFAVNPESETLGRTTPNRPMFPV